MITKIGQFVFIDDSQPCMDGRWIDIYIYEYIYTYIATYIYIYICMYIFAL
jgi:hypothetical protein